MKSYTDVAQSKKLAEFLPLESADMCYGINDDTLKYDDLPWLIPYHKYTFKEFYIPCWSLAALLEVLDFAKCDIHKDIYGWKCYTWPNNWKYDSNWNDNPIDACVEMILKLNEQKLL